MSFPAGNWAKSLKVTMSARRIPLLEMKFCVSHISLLLFLVVILLGIAGCASSGGNMFVK
jgi:hypothetical protein